jgi:hypothetical protein
MSHLKEVLTTGGIASADIDKLEAFESRDGFMVLDKDECEDMREYLRSYPVYQFLVPYTTDGNSNYWCLYVNGPLKNMTCYLSHEEADLSPRFRSLSSFIDAINTHPGSCDMQDFGEDVFDFPSRQVSPSYSQDQEIIGALYHDLTVETDDDQRRAQTAFAIMALASPTDIETIIYPFLEDEDMYVQERAIALLGFHAYQPAVAQLTLLVANAQPTGRMAAKVALQKIAASGQQNGR